MVWLSGLGTISFGTYAIIAWKQQQFDVVIICLSVIGGLIGFFPYNRKTSKKTFMGDVGSLALGGLLAKQFQLFCIKNGRYF